MLSNFIVSVNAVLPIFLLIVLGMLAGKKHYLTDTELNHANKAVFQVMFPIMMFYNVYSADFSGMVVPSYIVFCVIMVLVVYFFGVAVSLILDKDNRNRGAMIQAVYRSNFVLMGLPIMQNLMGDEVLGLTALMLAVIIPIYNVLAVVTFEIFRGGSLKPKEILVKIVTNPLICGAVVGILAVVLHVQLPIILEKPISQITAASSPVALLIMGASFKFESVKENLKDLIFGVVGKIILSPAIALFTGYLIGLRGMQLALLIVMFGAPCAVSGYTMAQQMDSNGDLAAGCLIFTSLFSCITITFWIFLFKQLGAF